MPFPNRDDFLGLSVTCRMLFLASKFRLSLPTQDECGRLRPGHALLSAGVLC